MKAVVLNGRQARSLVEGYDRIIDWVRLHAELCEEPDELRRLERAITSVYKVVDQVDAQRKAQR